MKPLLTFEEKQVLKKYIPEYHHENLDSAVRVRYNISPGNHHAVLFVTCKKTAFKATVRNPDNDILSVGRLKLIKNSPLEYNAEFGQIGRFYGCSSGIEKSTLRSLITEKFITCGIRNLAGATDFLDLEDFYKVSVQYSEEFLSRRILEIETLELTSMNFRKVSYVGFPLCKNGLSRRTNLDGYFSMKNKTISIEV